ncbi:Peptidase M10 metallopeptidase [Trinorchestia longiramus]|nr:Peptidase M10 metallopeptidase [Trinorchestia longiramus]
MLAVPAASISSTELYCKRYELFVGAFNTTEIAAPPNKYQHHLTSNKTISPVAAPPHKYQHYLTSSNITSPVAAPPHNIISYPGKMDGRVVERELRMATELWSKPSKLRFEYITEKPSSADIVVQFNRGYHGDGYPFDGPGRTLAHAFYPGPGIGGDIHFDADEKWVQHVDSHNGELRRSDRLGKRCQPQF